MREPLKAKSLLQILQGGLGKKGQRRTSPSCSSSSYVPLSSPLVPPSSVSILSPTKVPLLSIQSQKGNFFLPFPETLEFGPGCGQICCSLK